jgi:hypothetical protein
MNTMPAPIPRSEAFAEDIEGLMQRLQPLPAARRPSRRMRRLVNLLPVLVALAGLAFAVLPASF